MENEHRIPPQAVDVEMGVLGALLYGDYPDLLYNAMGLLKTDYFYNKIFRSISVIL